MFKKNTNEGYVKLSDKSNNNSISLSLNDFIKTLNPQELDKYKDTIIIFVNMKVNEYKSGKSDDSRYDFLDILSFSCGLKLYIYRTIADTYNDEFGEPVAEEVDRYVCIYKWGDRNSKYKVNNFSIWDYKLFNCKIKNLNNISSNAKKLSFILEFDFKYMVESIKNDDYITMDTKYQKYKEHYNTLQNTLQKDTIKRYLEFFESRNHWFKKLLFWIHRGHWAIAISLCLMLICIILDAVGSYFWGSVSIFKDNNILPFSVPFGDVLANKIMCNQNVLDRFINCFYHIDNRFYRSIWMFTNFIVKLATLYFGWLAVIAIKKRYFGNKIPQLNTLNKEDENNIKKTKD